MTWAISIPHRSRDESLVDVAAHARHLGLDEDRTTVRQLVIQARLDGVATTAGELIDHIAGLEPHERLAMLDRARVEAGLPSVEDVEFRRGVEAMRCQSSFPANVACAKPDCVNMATRNGVVYQPAVRRWWCPDHEHLAKPGDMEPRGSGLRFGENGVIVPIDLDDDEREQDRADHEAKQRAERHRERQAEAEAYRAWTAARDAGHDAELPPHLRSRP